MTAVRLLLAILAVLLGLEFGPTVAGVMPEARAYSYDMANLVGATPSDSVPARTTPPNPRNDTHSSRSSPRTSAGVVRCPPFSFLAAKTAARACSFAGATVVLMADGSRKPIEDIKVGDEVMATDPETGEQVAGTVEQVFVHMDTVVDLVVDGEVISTTEDHPFWSVTDQRFERADELSPGEEVLGSDGRIFAVSELRVRTKRVDVAYNLSVEGIHTYHVGRVGALVHNTCNPSRMAQEVARGQGPRGIERVDLPHRGVPGSQPHITFSDDLPTLNLDGTWGHLGRNGGRVPNITNRQRRWLESHGWPVPD